MSISDTVSRLAQRANEPVMGPKVAITCRVKEHRADRLDAVAKRLGWTRTAMAELLLGEAIEEAHSVLFPHA